MKSAAVWLAVVAGVMAALTSCDGESVQHFHDVGGRQPSSGADGGGSAGDSATSGAGTGGAATGGAGGSGGELVAAGAGGVPPAEPSDAGGDAASAHGAAAGSDAGDGASGAGGAGGTPCEILTWYADSDGDGYGDPEVVLQSCLRPDGFELNDDDCYDGNAEARPGPRPAYPPIEYQEDDRGDGSWDYDCDGEETPLWTKIGTCPDVSTDPVTPGTDGWWGSVPGCGEDGLRKTNAASCPGVLLDITQKCW